MLMSSIDSDEEKARTIILEYQADLQYSLEYTKREYQKSTVIEQQRGNEFYHKFLSLLERHLEEAAKEVKEPFVDFVREYICMVKRHRKESREFKKIEMLC